MSDHWMGVDALTNRRREVVTVGTALACLALLVPVQLVSMIAFDATGLDTVTPWFVMMAVVPAVLSAAIPGGIASKYTRRTLAWATGIFLAHLVVALYLSQFYGICGGPSC